ncbi:chromo-domain-containing protein [Phanerochaete sordida]|uniref:Chromo-domain-containing protein n=1 Tax=Phanerochaete sordida TaxID=48140 RepID=A0A9P3GBX8_9APHY|nr:chromo-domain-containing protein [Phanerochaete sordida]
MPKVVRAADLAKVRPAPPLGRPITSYGTSPKAPKQVTLGAKVYKVNAMLPLFFKFACERHHTQQRRLAGLPQPWTEDKIIADWPFTNVFRVLDRNTQYILRHVVREGSQDLEESVFRVILFRTFNKIETWEFLKEELGDLTWKGFDIKAYQNALKNAEQALYHNAYIMPAPKLGYAINYEAHLRLIEAMMDAKLPHELLRFKHLKDAHGYLSLYPSMGDFTTMQMLLDLNMLPHFQWSEDEWVALGPGSRACLEKMFGADMRNERQAAHALRYLRDAQASWYNWLSVPSRAVPRLSPARAAGLSMVDIEHALCECEKYSRAGLPSFSGARTKVGKRAFRPRDGALTAELPAHWLTPPPVTIAAVIGQPPARGEDEYEVEAIVAERGKLYCVRWAGWSIDDDSWEPRENLEGAQELLDAWNEKKRLIWEAIDSRRKGSEVTVAVTSTASARITRKRKLSTPSDLTEEEEDVGRMTRSSRKRRTMS